MNVDFIGKDRKVSDDSNWHIVIIALNHSALRQLNLAISLANETGFYKKARLDYELISKLTPEISLFLSYFTPLLSSLNI